MVHEATRPTTDSDSIIRRVVGDAQAVADEAEGEHIDRHEQARDQQPGSGCAGTDVFARGEQRALTHRQRADARARKLSEVSPRIIHAMRNVGCIAGRHDSRISGGAP